MTESPRKDFITITLVATYDITRRIYASVIDTVLFSCLCVCVHVCVFFCLAVYFNNFISQVVEIFRVVACRIQRVHA